ncbi:hypothetical protein A8924_1749 [Saccharopolyspora erythraea NRRL 2338]|uniref:Uncharacterized protein n=2 Tax=Saccharopolyspora erythraea TaxID=1836 RepID=A4F9F0_SACEN|nr:hypothetical protein [Saccharopolyspora erythraea]EQD87377.1 hypothetical protein N599_04965 [Saccharopolyspora erythraea D]PFG94463.1 hypothetical protein A8924_1749 [Saccharopolyspora erythraea NRRL 2338]QRK91219.1 hypothetical protein JQX30_07315 [Saccharopolyspora erythraea]CAM00675.1 hypothetical protein SACE_1352 [Saccharopolyspora erythraea NRRL 2338]
MDTAIVLILIGVVVIVAAVWWSRQRAAARRQAELDDSRAEARRWLERLSGQVVNLIGTNDAAKQALADASERHNAAGSQMEQAASATQCKLVTETALEGLYYVRAARVAMDMDPGPELPDLSGQRGAGRVTEFREVEVDGRQQVASPEPTDRTPHYYPGGTVAGRPVPEGWYSEPWWRPAMLAGTWGVGSFVLMSAMFTGMAGVPAAAYADSPQDFGADGAADGGGFDGGGFDMGGFDMGGF